MLQAPSLPVYAAPRAEPVRLRDRASDIRWRWTHLVALGAVAFLLPIVLTVAMAPREQLSSFLDAALYFQVVAYVLAALLAIHMVRKGQRGDWSTLGISWDRRAIGDAVGGAAFGLLLIGGFLAASFAINGGRLEMDALVKTLLGSTTGMGLALGAVVVVIGAPIIEEVYFRGILFEKLARRDMWLAILVTTVLFTAVHGALVIVPIMLLGAALAWKRQRRSLWYTIGAHAAWNLVVLSVGASMLLGSWTFSPPDGAYIVTFPKSWERDAPLTLSPVAGHSFDLTATSSSGSFVGVTRVPAVKGSARATIEKLIKEADRAGMAGFARTEIQTHPHPFDEGAEGLQISYGLNGMAPGGGDIGVHVFVMAVPGSDTAIVFNLTCERRVCPDETRHFDVLLHEADLAPASL